MPTRRPNASGLSKTTPATDSRAVFPRCTVGRAWLTVARCVAVSGKDPAPATEMSPPGAITDPSRVTVPDLKVTLAPASVRIDAPFSITISPRISRRSRVNGSSRPRPVKLRLTGARKPSSLVMRRNRTSPFRSGSSSAIKLWASGRSFVPAAMAMAGMYDSSCPAGGGVADLAPIPVSEYFVNPPCWKKSSARFNVAGLAVPPI